MAVNKVIYGDQTLIDLTSDTVTDPIDVVDGKYFHKKDGNRIAGSRPKFYKYKSDTFVSDQWPKYNDDSGDRVVMKLGDYEIKIRQKPSSTAYVQLYTIKSDGVTESAVDLCQPGASYVFTVRITRVWYITRWFAMFTYRWETNASGYRNGIQQRGIAVKLDGTIVLGSVNNWSSTADSSTVIGEGWFFPTLLSGGTDFLFFRKVTTISSGQYSIAAYKIYNNPATAASSYNSSSGNNMSISADPDNYLPDFDICPSRGGFFYKNASGVDSIFIENMYGNDSFRNVTLANAGTDISNIGALDHYILGYLKSGYLLTYKHFYGFYLWDYDHTSTSNMFKRINKNKVIRPLDVYEFPVTYYESPGLVIYNNKLHYLANNGHYSWDGTEWTEESTLPYSFRNGSTVVYNGEIHILGGYVTTNRRSHYIWNGTTWSEGSAIPYDFRYGSAVVYNNKIHILGGSDNPRYHYSWSVEDGWIKESTLPYNFNQGAAVVYLNTINILGGAGSGNNMNWYSWDGSSWTRHIDLPYFFYGGSAVVYKNGYYDEIHILGSYSSGDKKKHSYYSSRYGEWKDKSNLVLNGDFGSAVVIYDSIYMTANSLLMYDALSNYNIRSFQNDIILYGDGRRAQIICNSNKQFELKRLEDSEIKYYRFEPYLEIAGSESDFMNGLISY